MHIGIDARTILNPEHGDGIGNGHYTYQLIRHLLEIDTKNTYTIFFDYRARTKDIKKFTKDNTRVRFYPFSDYKKYLPGAYNELLGRAILTRDHLDVLHSTSPTSRIPVGYSGKCITTIHNMGVFAYPGMYPGIRKLKEQTLIRYMAKKSDVLLVSSDSIAQDLQKYAEVSQEKMRIIPSGLDKRFFDTPVQTKEQTKKKFHVTKKAILFLGTLTPINNIEFLLRSFQSFKKEFEQKKKEVFPYQLVLAGKFGWKSKQYKVFFRENELEEDVIFTGYITGDDLVPLFHASEFCVLPTLYEGFGTTVLESFATKTPAIVSEIDSLKDLARDAAYLIDPKDKKSLLDAFWRFSQDEDLRKEYAEKGYAIAQKYSWEKMARETLKIYEFVHTKK